MCFTVIFYYYKYRLLWFKKSFLINFNNNFKYSLYYLFEKKCVIFRILYHFSQIEMFKASSCPFLLMLSTMHIGIVTCHRLSIFTVQEVLTTFFLIVHPITFRHDLWIKKKLVLIYTSCSFPIYLLQISYSTVN